MNDLPQPSRKNWRLYGWVVAGGIALTMLVVFLAIHGSDGRPQNEEKIAQRGTTDKMPDRTFSPPPPPPPPHPEPVITTPTPVSLPPSKEIQQIRQPPAKMPTSEKPRPMTTMFVTGEDSRAFSEQKNVSEDGNIQNNSGIFLDPKDNRPGNSESVSWLNSAGNDGRDFVVSPYIQPKNQYVLQAGTIIKATLLNNVNSDLPGDIVAMVNDNVLDTATGRYILIPATAKLYGRYSDTMRYGQTRAQVSWNRILFPNAASQNIGSMSGTDAGGAAGIEGDVDHHIGSMTAAVGVSAFMTVLSQAGAMVSGGTGGSTNIGSMGIDGGGREVQSIGREFVTRELDRPNTLSLKAGTQVAVMLSRDIITLRPYEGVPDSYMVESK